MAALDPVLNFAKATIATPFDALATTIQLAAGQGAKFPNASDAAWNGVVWNSSDYPDPADDPNVEIVRVTAGGGVAGDTLTVVRAQENTTATQKQNVGKIYKMQLALTAKMIADIAANFSGTVSLKFIQVTGSIPGTSFTLASAKSGQSVIIQNNTTFFEGVDYTVSGTALTWLYPLTAPFTSPLTLICVG